MTRSYLVSTITCPRCDFSCKHEKKLYRHLESDHSVSEPLTEYIQSFHAGSHPTCDCDCGEILPWSGWKRGFTSKYLRGHNARKDSSFFDPKQQKKMGESRAKGYREGRYQVWNAGLTKETSDKINEMSDKISIGLRSFYDEGGTSWQKRDPKKHKIASLKISSAKSLAEEEVRRRVSELPLNFDIISDLSQEYITRQRSLLQFLCRDCNEIQEKTLKNLEDTPRCFTCHPRESFNQIEIRDFISGLIDEEIIMSDRSLIGPKEVDVYIPSQKFGIEFNGLTFHTENDLPRDYHHQKTSLCKDMGVTLMHIFGDEWRGPKRPIVESMIRSRLGRSEERIGARTCDVAELTSKERQEFFEMNHLDGDVKAKRSWGLKNSKGLVVCALSLRRPFHKKYAVDYLEVGRFASLKNTSVPGGLGRLMKHAKTWAKNEGYKGLVSYADLRHGTGESYEKVGFIESHLTDIRFWWTDKSSRYDRFSVRADPTRGLTEKQVAEEERMTRIYGCRNRVFILNF